MKMHMNFKKAENKIGFDKIGNQRLTPQQFGAIRLAAEIGDAIRKNNPEIAEEYRNGATAPKLVAIHKFDHRYGVSRVTAITAVRIAIRGYPGFCYESYHGLITDRSERERLALMHNSQTGMEEYKRKRGIHALNCEQKAEASRKGGLIAGPLSYRLRIGCHALPPEALREHCRRIAPLGGKAGGVASVVAKGLVPYTPASPGRIAEVEFAFRLAADSRYRGSIRANVKKIAEKVNEVFHAGNARYTQTTLKNALRSYRKRSGSAGELSTVPETAFAEKLTREPAYQLPARIKASEIARKVNEEYHGGRPVRNHESISDAIQRYRKQNEFHMARLITAQCFRYPALVYDKFNYPGAD
jgi:hypothetical protein